MFAFQLFAEGQILALLRSAWVNVISDNNVRVIREHLIRHKKRWEHIFPEIGSTPSTAVLDVASTEMKNRLELRKLACSDTIVTVLQEFCKNNEQLKNLAVGIPSKYEFLDRQSSWDPNTTETFRAFAQQALRMTPCLVQDRLSRTMERLLWYCVLRPFSVLEKLSPFDRITATIGLIKEKRSERPESWDKAPGFISTDADSNDRKWYSLHIRGDKKKQTARTFLQQEILARPSDFSAYDLNTETYVQLVNILIRLELRRLKTIELADDGRDAIIIELGPNTASFWTQYANREKDANGSDVYEKKWKWIKPQTSTLKNFLKDVFVPKAAATTNSTNGS